MSFKLKSQLKASASSLALIQRLIRLRLHQTRYFQTNSCTDVAVGYLRAV